MKAARILLVEKDLRERSDRATLLAASGYAVETAAGLDEAVTACDRAQPDLVLVGLERNAAKVSAVVATLRARVAGVRIAVLMHKTHRLCAVALDDAVVIRAEQPADFLQRVALLVAAPSPAARAVAAG
jgi:DNA-binding response OmpR family regulator